ncbi:B12-binding domain-containing radical SAM protein [Pseudomonas solani]|uniref:B12-binding domain-containing radical SAM protein n=1 Tax=Pseudomonas solani TaxID=2731552 RepID=UPI003C2DA280
MDITLINPPHTAIGSRMPREHLPPLGLLAIGGPLLDAGFHVSLLDADREGLNVAQIVARIQATAPDVVMLGHSGSSSAHPTVVDICRALKGVLPGLVIVYGGVHPSYHWDEILQEVAEVDFIVRGEGEQTALSLMQALAQGHPPLDVHGIALRYLGEPYATPAAAMLRNLDDYRVGWELIDHAHYSYWGGKRAVVVQFSRGVPTCATTAGSVGSGPAGGTATRCAWPGSWHACTGNRAWS